VLASSGLTAVAAWHVSLIPTLHTVEYDSFIKSQLASLNKSQTWTIDGAVARLVSRARVRLEQRLRQERYLQRFRGGLVFKAHRLCVSLNSRIESNKEEERNITCPHKNQDASGHRLNLSIR